MSRAERRAYQRMTKNQDPYAAPPVSGAAKARIERQRELRARRPAVDPEKLLPGRWLYWLIGGTAGAFLLGLSLAWPTGSGFALLVGAAAGVAWLALLLALAAWRRRARLAAPAPRNRPAAR